MWIIVFTLHVHVDWVLVNHKLKRGWLHVWLSYHRCMGVKLLWLYPILAHVDIVLVGTLPNFYVGSKALNLSPIWYWLELAIVSIKANVGQITKVMWLRMETRMQPITLKMTYFLGCIINYISILGPPSPMDGISKVKLPTNVILPNNLKAKKLRCNNFPLLWKTSLEYGMR